MGENDITLKLKTVGEITGRFLVPAYQRGYRWGKREVTRLLDDIKINCSGDKKYCLQPVVVKKRSENEYELIDGQQRLTTLFIMLKCICKHMSTVKIKYSLEYETRAGSASFLERMDADRQYENIDFYHMYRAFQYVDEWISDPAEELYHNLVENVNVIWYEVSSGENAADLFTRLNIGKIPLTNAELVKAMFLASGSKGAVRQGEIALQWDNIERELHNETLWYFLTNDVKKQYQTCIDLVLDIAAEKTYSHDPYYAFYYFYNKRGREGAELKDIWDETNHTFLTLKDWFENAVYYHKIGYLIASESETLLNIYRDYVGKTKTEFKNFLNGLIQKSVQCGDYSSLRYGKDNELIKRILLLFNVETSLRADNGARRFPFGQYKNPSGNVKWSLEHIHAQQSERLRNKEAWVEWIARHISTVKRIGGSEELVERMNGVVKSENVDRETFSEIYDGVFDLYSASGINAENMHMISNLALLNTADNAALNNATFDDKRDDIIRMDKNGQFIPPCTKNVFLKYYTSSDSNQLYFWGEADRAAYIGEINAKLKDYGVYIDNGEKEDD